MHMHYVISNLGLEHPSKMGARRNSIEAMDAYGWKGHACGVGCEIHTSMFVEVHCGLHVVSILSKYHEYLFFHYSHSQRKVREPP